MASDSHLKAYQKNSAPQGYTNAPQPGSPTYTEAWALIESARRMAKSIEHGIIDDPNQRRDVRDALRLNWRLWTIFQSELTIAEANPVPDDIRTNMLTLCRFVDQHTIDTMANPTPEKIVALIDINRNIASGLLDSIKATAAADAQNTVPSTPPLPAGTEPPETPAQTSNDQPAATVPRIDHEA